jgi:hypothetical protein
LFLKSLYFSFSSPIKLNIYRELRCLFFSLSFCSSCSQPLGPIFAVVYRGNFCGFRPIIRDLNELNRICRIVSGNYTVLRMRTAAFHLMRIGLLITVGLKLTQASIHRLLNGVPWQMCLQSIRTAIDLPFGSIFLSKKY